MTDQAIIDALKESLAHFDATAHGPVIEDSLRDRLQKAIAALSEPEQEISNDLCIELAQALEQLRAMKIAEDVAALPIGGADAVMPTPFHAGYQLACEDIIYRLKTEVWGDCLPPVDAIAALSEQSQAEPVAWQYRDENILLGKRRPDERTGWTPLFTSPQPSPMSGILCQPSKTDESLTEDEVQKLCALTVLELRALISPQPLRNDVLDLAIAACKAEGDRVFSMGMFDASAGCFTCMNRIDDLKDSS